MGADVSVIDAGLRADPAGDAASVARVFEAARPMAAGRRPRGFAGFSWGQLGLGAALAAFAVWGFWMTNQISLIAERRIVAVSLSGMVNEFVAAEARSGNGPEQVQFDTRRFMFLMQQVLAERATRGQTVIVGEAIVAGSAPDITAEVRQEVGKRMIAGRNAAGGVGGAPLAPGGVLSRDGQ